MAAHTMPYKIVTYGFSDTGLVRHNNEDYWAGVPLLNFYALADGMGGHRAGEVASKEAVTILCKIMEETVGLHECDFTIDEIHGILQFAIETVNESVYKMGRSNPSLKGMGTTLCCVHFHSTGLVYAHVGDSRIYRYRNKKLEQLTHDHSLLRELADMGQLDDHRANNFAYKNVITRAIGTESYVEPAVHTTDVCEGDIYLMCSDGLSDMLSSKEIEKIITHNTASMEKACKKLISKANEKGGNDNVTAVLTKVEGFHDIPDLS